MTFDHVTGSWSFPKVLYGENTTDKIKFKLIETSETSFENAEKDLTEFLSFSKDQTLANALYITNNDIMNVKNVHLVPVFRVTYGGKMKSMVVETQQVLLQADTIHDEYDNINDYSISGYNHMNIENHADFCYPTTNEGVKRYTAKRGNFKWNSGN
jgi:hypothetical protein